MTARRNELSRIIRNALCALPRTDDVRGTPWIAEQIGKTLADCHGPLNWMEDVGLVERVQRRARTREQFWRATEMARRLSPDVALGSRPAMMLRTVIEMGGEATVTTAAHELHPEAGPLHYRCARARLMRLVEAGALRVLPDVKPQTFVVAALALLMLAVPATAHDQYLGWTHDRKGLSCCTGVGHSAHGDCQPVKLCNGDTGFLEPGTGRCIPIASDAITTPLPTMTDEPHACWRAGGAIQYCVSRGSQG